MTKSMTWLQSVIKKPPHPVSTFIETFVVLGIIDWDNATPFTLVCSMRLRKPWMDMKSRDCGIGWKR